MRITIEVPDRVADAALREHRTPRQQAEYLIARALERDERREPGQPSNAQQVAAMAQ
jgi:hypothetical protein